MDVRQAVVDVCTFQQTTFMANTSDPRIILRKYLFSQAQRHAMASGIQQAISACRLLQELDLCPQFVPQNVWRLVRGKERLASTGRSQRWGSLEVLDTMIQIPRGPGDPLPFGGLVKELDHRLALE